MKKSILNSFALLAWIQDEPGAQIVEDVLYKAQDESEGALLNIINLCEVYYGGAHVQDSSFARDIVEKIRLLPLTIYSCPQRPGAKGCWNKGTISYFL